MIQIVIAQTTGDEIEGASKHVTFYENGQRLVSQVSFSDEGIETIIAAARAVGIKVYDLTVVASTEDETQSDV